MSDGAVAQLGERRNGIAKVRGSIPLGSTILLNDLARNVCSNVVLSYHGATMSVAFSRHARAAAVGTFVAASALSRPGGDASSTGPASPVALTSTLSKGRI